MRLSDVSGERTLDVIADVISPLISITSDKALADTLERRQCPEGMDPKEFMLQRISKNVPNVIRGHKEDVIAILSAIGGVSKEEYVRGMTLMSLINDVMELVNDAEFMDFLASLPQTVERAGSPSESTEDR